MRLLPHSCPLSHSFHHISQAVHLLSFLWRSPKAASFKLRTSITSSNMSFPLVVPLHWFNSQQFPWSQLDTWRLRAGQYQPCHRKGICSEAFSFFHQLFLQIGGNLTQSVTVFRVLKMLTFCLGLHTLNMQHFKNSSSLCHQADLAIASATIKLALTTASLWNVASVNTVCHDTKLLFISSAFWRFCCLSWCFVS